MDSTRFSAAAAWVLAALLLIPQTVLQAQEKGAINPSDAYLVPLQGVLTNADGNPAAPGERDWEARYWSDAIPGIWSVDNGTATIGEGGQFKILLDPPISEQQLADFPIEVELAISQPGQPVTNDDFFPERIFLRAAAEAVSAQTLLGREPSDFAPGDFDLQDAFDNNGIISGDNAPLTLEETPLILEDSVLEIGITGTPGRSVLRRDLLQLLNPGENNPGANLGTSSLGSALTLSYSTSEWTQLSAMENGGNLVLRGPSQIATSIPADQVVLSGAPTPSLETEGAGPSMVFLSSEANSQRIAQIFEEQQSGYLELLDSVENISVRIAGESGSGGGAFMRLLNSEGNRTLRFDADENDAGFIQIGAPSGTTTIELDGLSGGITASDYNTKSGADVAELFDVSAGAPEPGDVLCIDPENPGRLVLCEGAYDPLVAGVVSGAGGLRSGMTLSQTGTMADGEHPVALSGRVYANAVGPVQPGDLMTTAPEPGHAQAVSDRAASQGAVLGKAMTALPAGETGLVLVLVALQ